MANWLWDKRITISLQIIICVSVYVLTRSHEILCGVLAVFIIMELAFVSLCNDHYSMVCQNSLKYSRCYHPAPTNSKSLKPVVEAKDMRSSKIKKLDLHT